MALIWMDSIHALNSDQNHQRINSNTNITRKILSPIINKIGLIPTEASSLICVFIPKALIAIIKNQRDNSFVPF